MNVYTISSRDEPVRDMPDFTVYGSYTSRGSALDACVGYIMDRLGIRDDLAWSMAHDENHEEAAKFFEEVRSKTEPRNHITRVRRGKHRALRSFLRDELGGSGYYHVYDCEGDAWRFDINENDLEGELWRTVTWGDSDCEDPEFTTPWPETFVTEDAAIMCFVNYAKDMMASHGMKIPDDFYAVVEQQLNEDGKCQVDLNDGCCVSCAIYHDDAKNVRE